MQSQAATIAEYLDEIPQERRADMERVIALVRDSLPDGYVETMNWGMICWEVPLERSGKTYNGKPLMYVALASQKRHMALYLCGANCTPIVRERMKTAFETAGKKFDMGAACLRFRSADDLAEQAVADVVAATPVDAFVAASKR